jgi:DNA-binding transcriptional MerR regulator
MKKTNGLQEIGYRTSQIAAMLDIEEWRVKNLISPDRRFKYRLRLGLRKKGRGRGRRLFTLRDVFRITLANELLRCGFSPADVGKGANLVNHLELLPSSTPLDKTPVLVRIGGVWSLTRAAELTKIAERLYEREEAGGVFLLNVQACLHAAWESVERYLLGGMTPPTKPERSTKG